MKKFLPILFIGVLFLFQLFLPVAKTFAATTTTTTPTQVLPNGTWVDDPEVTFVGKNAARSAEFLKWTLQDYDWITINQDGTNPLIPFWTVIRNIVYDFSVLFVLIMAFIIIITRGQSTTIMRFIPRFIGFIILVTFSFAFIQFIYQVTDVSQAFFLRVDPAQSCPPKCISSDNLLSIGFNYQSFQGLREVGSQYDESAFITLLLTKLTAITYYSMSGILLLRKIILWFFLILSPLFAILLLYNPLRNTAKTWTREFLLWLLYAPLFSVLLAGLVSLWRGSSPIPLLFTASGSITYDTAVNILLGGPGQSVSATNSINTPDTFAFYIVALIMLWVVIILPFLLLQIFLNYVNKISINDVASHPLFARGMSFFGKGSPPPAPAPYSSTGSAKAIPAQTKFSIQIPKSNSQSIVRNESVVNNISQNLSQSNPRFQNENNSNSSESQVIRLANLSIPTMRDVASYETKIMSSDIRKHEDVAQMRETLQKISNPSTITDQTERLKFTQIRHDLDKESIEGNPSASAILSAALTLSTPETQRANIQKVLHQISHPDAIVNPIQRKQFSDLSQKIIAQDKQGDEIASSVIRIEKGPVTSEQAQKFVELLKDKKEKSNIASEILSLIFNKSDTKVLPAVNKVQQVTIEDYNAVKKVWKESYSTMSPPHDPGAPAVDRKTWVKSDIEKISSIVNDLSSLDKEKVAEGMKQVSSVLPFFLIGGFSQSEIIAYLKAKEEAGNEVLTELDKNDYAENSANVKMGLYSKPKEKADEASLDQNLTK